MCITLEHVTKRFGERSVLEDVNLCAEAGERICLYGPSGCGKTTLMRIIAGLEVPDGGVVTVSKGLRFSVQFQENRLLPWYTAGQNLMLIRKDPERIGMLLEQAGLADTGKLYPDELSGGMKRRVSLIRALLDESDALLLDEPLRELDESATAVMTEMIGQNIGGRLLILVTHDLRQAKALGCRVLTYPFHE